MTVLVALAAGCAKYNTYYNAKKAFDSAERVREDAIRKNQDPPKPTGAQKTDYETAIAKSQKILDEYPGHNLTDDALFLRAKAYYRLESYRMSIRQFDLLFTNFPATEYLEESLYLQALNYLLLGALDRSQDYLGQLERAFPDSRYQAEVSRVSGDNAFTLEDWAAAAAAYREYLALGDQARERDRVALKLAECLWQQAAHAEADTVLEAMLADVAPGELRFRAELLRGRVQVRAGALDQASTILDGLDQAAAFHKAEGELALVRAELLVARGQADDAAALLQNMPTEWQTPVVKARVADMLGLRFVERQEYAEALEQFKTALTQRNELDDPERTRRLNEQLKDYMAADQALTDAKGDRLPRLKLMQANAMLFGFERPERAAELYREAAADTAADSLLVPRALYGLWLVYGQKLDDPDSAAAAAARLQALYPESVQAREIRAEGGVTLVDFLLAERRSEQERNLAGLSAEEREALETVNAAPEAGAGGAAIGGPAVRRRMVYLARRDHLVFPPPDVVIAVGGRAAATEGGLRDPAAPPPAGRTFGSVGGAVAPVDSTGRVDGVGQAGGVPLPATDGGTPGGDPAAAAGGSTDEEGAKPAEPDKTPEPAEPVKPKKERDPNWDRLRTPTPEPQS